MNNIIARIKGTTGVEKRTGIKAAQKNTLTIRTDKMTKSL